MKKIILLLALSFAIISGCKSPESKVVTASPESLGLSSQAILDFINTAETTRPDDIHSFVLMRHGKVAAKGWWDPYNPESPHMLFSLSKSFTSTAIGIAQSEGLLSINDKVISFFPGDVPANPSANLQSMRIRDLLRMNTGHEEDATGRMRMDTVSWVKAFLSLDVEHKPGTRFVYNSAATFMLSAIIQKVSGKTLLEYLTPRLFEPLGIEHPTWETAPGGINTGGWGLKIRTQDIANFGQLYLQKGNWQGKQLVPAEWVEEATKLQTCNGSDPDSDWDQGYGYQFWRCRHNLYRGDGAFGQYCIVFPEQDAVLAITSGTTDMGAIMNIVWDKLLPAMKENALEENKEAFTALQKKLGSLGLSKVKAQPDSPMAGEINGKSFQLKPNREGIKGLEFKLEAGTTAVTFITAEGSFTLLAGSDSLVKCNLPGAAGENVPAASSAGWSSPDTLVIRTYLYETPFRYMTKVSFGKDGVRLTRNINVSMGPSSELVLEGK
jgi:CubicO group peptidase (beta-lactamase class C family)